MRPVLTALGVFWAVGLSSVASAQTVEQGRELYLGAEFEGAVAAFEEVLSSAELTEADAIEAERYLTTLFTMLGDGEAARRHAEAATALDAQVSAPEGAPPEAEQLLRDVARERGGPARITIEQGPDDVSARIDPVPTGLVTRLRLRCGASTEESEPPAVTLYLEDDAEGDCEATALSRGGVALFDATLSLGATATETPSLASEGEGAPIWPWIVAGAGALVVIGVIVTVIVVATGGGDQAAFGDTRVEGW